MKDIDKRSGGGLEIRFLINSMDLNWCDTKVDKVKGNFFEGLTIRILCNFVLMWAKK